MYKMNSRDLTLLFATSPLGTYQCHVYLLPLCQAHISAIFTCTPLPSLLVSAFVQCEADMIIISHKKISTCNSRQNTTEKFELLTKFNYNYHHYRNCYKLDNSVQSKIKTGQSFRNSLVTLHSVLHTNLLPVECMKVSFIYFVDLH